jgi:hypothetical protein
MPIYDSMTPFEQQEPPSPETKRPKLEKRQYSGNPPTSPGSQCFDISAAWYNHPGPFSVQAIRPITPHPVLLRHEVPELSHHSSTASSASEKDRGPPHCHRCGPISELSELNIQTSDCCVCANIARERERPNTPAPSPADVFNPRSHALLNHHHRRHSLFYEPIPLSVDKGVEPLRLLVNPIGQESTAIEVESNPLEEESNLLEGESNPLEQEAKPLEEAHGYENPYYPGAEEQLSRPRVSLEDWEIFCRVQNARSELWLENEKASSASASQVQGKEVERGRSPERRKEHHTKTTFEVRKDENFYGKYV